MRIGFYAPLKPPDHPAPSGDRRIARLFIAALRGLGHDVVLLSQLRSYNRIGDTAQETAIQAAATAEVERLSADWRRDPTQKPDLLFTYHVYHKAADYIGPALKQRFGLPYVIAEASMAPKRQSGPWAAGYAAAAAAISAADALLAITTLDRACLTAFAGSEIVTAFPPFLDPAPFATAATHRTQWRNSVARQFGLPAQKPWLLAVGMFRAGDKLASFRRLAETMPLMQMRDWHLLLVGDGPERASVAAAFASLSDCVTFAGQCEPDALAGIYAACDLYVWPAINEAYGMALLEAQAAGLPVLSVDTRGVPDIVRHGETGWLCQTDAAADLAPALDRLLADPAQRQAMAKAALTHAQGDLSLQAAQQRLTALFGRLGLRP